MATDESSNLESELESDAAMYSPNFDYSTNRDMPSTAFPLDLWQNQKQYHVELFVNDTAKKGGGGRKNQKIRKI